MSVYRKSFKDVNSDMPSLANTHQDRINKIFDKLSGIKSGMEVQKQKQYNNLESRIEGMFQQLDEAANSFEKDTNSLKDSVLKIERIVEGQAMYKQKVTAKNIQIDKYQLKYTQILENQIRARKDTESKIVRTIEDKMSLLKMVAHQETKLRQKCLSDIHESLESDLPKLASLVQQETKMREESDNQLMHQISEQLNILNQQLVTLTEVREESEASIYQMLKNVLKKVGEELFNERRAREDTEEAILVLIEGMCDKVVTEK